MKLADVSPQGIRDREWLEEACRGPIRSLESLACVASSNVILD